MNRAVFLLAPLRHCLADTLRSAFVCASVVIGAGFVASVGGCAVNDHFSDQAGRLDSSIETVRDRVILDNIARASVSAPLNFTSISTVHASNQTNAALGLPAVSFGPHQPIADHIYTFGGGSGAGSPNAVSTIGITSFDMSILESNDFYRGMLTPISPAKADVFASQGLPREVIYYLFTDGIVVGAPGSVQRKEFHNDPLDPSFDKFKYYLTLGIKYGITFEPVGESAKTNAVPRVQQASAELSSTGTGKGAAAKDQPLGPETKLGLCFEPRLAQPGANMSGVAPICGRKTKRSGSASEITIPELGTQSLEVMPRSPFEVFQYLGHLVALDDRGLIPLVSEEAKREGPDHDPFLFQVTHAIGPDCLIDTVYANQSYCVPAHGMPNSTRIIGMLSQLVAMATSVNDLPVVQTVRIAQ